MRSEVLHRYFCLRILVKKSAYLLLFICGLLNNPSFASEIAKQCLSELNERNVSAEMTCERALEQELSENISQSELNLRSEIYTNLSTLMIIQGNIDKAQDLLADAVTENPFLAEENYYRYNWLRRKGILYFHQEQFSQALPIMQELLQLAGKLILEDGNNKQEMLGTSNNDVASTLMELGRYQEAMEYYRRALDVFTDLARPYSAAFSLAGIAIAHKDLGDLDTAEVFFKRAIESHDDNLANYGVNIPFSKSARIQTKVRLADVYIAQERLNEAQQLLTEAQSFYETNSEPNDLIKVLVAKSKIAMLEGQLNQAGTILQSALDVEQRNALNPSFGLQKQLTLYYEANNQAARAKEVAESAAEQAMDQQHLQSKLFFLKWLAEHYSKQQNYRRSQEYFNLYIDLYETYLNDKYSPAVADLKSLTEVKRQQQEIALLEQEQNAAQYRLSQQRLIIGLCICFSVILAIMCIVLWRQKSRQKVSLNREITMHRNELLRLAEQDAQATSEQSDSEVADNADNKSSANDTLTAFHQQIVELMCLSCELWEQSTGLTRLELAEQSKIWLVVIDDGRLRTRTMDKYLSFQRLPKHPRWRQVIRTCRFVLVECKLTSKQRDALNNSLELTLSMQRTIAKQSL